MFLTYYAPALDVLWKLLKANDIEPAKVFKKYDLTYKDLRNQKLRVRLKVFNSLWRDAYDLIENPCFGLDLYKYWHPSHFGALGYAWLSSGTLREGFERLSRYIKLITDGSGIRIEEKENNLHIIHVHKEPNSVNPARLDAALSMLLHISRLNYDTSLCPSLVTFKHSKPTCAGDYFAYFKCNIDFDAKCYSMVFPVSVVDEPLTGANGQLAKLSDQLIIQYLHSLSQDDLEEKVKSIIIQNLPSGEVTGEMVASELGLTHRNLQRKLKELGTTYKQLYDESRHYLADKYLTEGTMSVTEMSFILGFSESSSFTRAYKRWTGYSPNTDR